MKTTHWSQYFSWNCYLKRHWSGRPTLFPCRLKCGLQRVCKQVTHFLQKSKLEAANIYSSMVQTVKCNTWQMNHVPDHVNFPVVNVSHFRSLAGSLSETTSILVASLNPFWSSSSFHSLWLHITSPLLPLLQAPSPIQPVTGAVGRSKVFRVRSRWIWPSLH